MKNFIYIGMCALWLVSRAGATTLGDAAAAMQEGEWREFTTEGLNSELFDLGCFGALLGYAEGGVWDPGSGQVLFIGQGHNAPQKFISYSEQTNSWQAEAKPYWDCSTCAASCIGHAFNHNAIDPVDGVFYYRKGTNVYRYGIASKTWDELPPIPLEAQVLDGGLAYSPEMGGLIFVGRSQIYRYLNATNQWTKLASEPEITMGVGSNFAEYCPIRKSILVGGGSGTDCCNTNPRAVYEIDAAGNIIDRGDSPVPLGSGVNFVAADPATNKMLAFSYADGTMWELDLQTDAWRTLPGKAPFAYDHFMAVPISSYGIILILNTNFHGSSAQVYLYKHSPSDPASTGLLSPWGAFPKLVHHPAQGILFLDLGIGTSEHNTLWTLEDFKGRKHLQFMPGVPVSIGGLAEGMYTVRGAGPHGVWSERLLIVR